MKIRAMLAATALAVGGLVLTAAPAHAACQANQTVSRTPNWSANCLTSGTSNKNSNLTVTIQLVLDWRGYQISAADGIFGPETTKAVKAFQSDNGLTSDGVVGPNTWKALAKQVAWIEESSSVIFFKILPHRPGPIEHFKLWKTGANKGRWEVLEHQPGCAGGGDGYTWMNSTRDCG